MSLKNFNFVIVKKKYKTAFSLIELSIVIVIVSILVTGALTASVSSVNNAKTKLTNERIQTIYKAMGNYLVVNGRIPCPASIISIKTSDSAYGAEIGSAGTCSGTGVYTSATATNLVYGAVPIRALGLGDEFGEDAFENKFTYVVHKLFTAAGSSSSQFGGATATSTITINEKSGSATHADTADAIFLIISHGANRSGGYNAMSSTQTTRSTDTDEMSNDNGGTPYTGFDATFVASSSNSATFDDIVFYKTRNQIASDFNALSSINCASATVSGYTMPIGYYNQNAVPTSGTTCAAGGYTKGPTYPQARCEAFGNWSTELVLPCY